MTTRMVVVLAVVAAVAIAPHAAQAASPYRVTFDKHAIDTGVWAGTTGGDAAGQLTSKLQSLEITGSIWHITVDWIVDAGDRSFTARLHGTLNTATGRVVMNGRVVNGWNDGARVHESGRMVDAAAGRFLGTIRIAPETAR